MPHFHSLECEIHLYNNSIERDESNIQSHFPTSKRKAQSKRESSHCHKDYRQRRDGTFLHPARNRARPLGRQGKSNSWFTGGTWGRGIANIMEACEQAGLPKPEFIKAPWITRIIFRFKTPLTPYLSGKGGNGSSSEPINEPLNEPLNYSNIQVKTTHDAIKSHPGIGRSGIMAQTGLSLPSVKRYIAELTAKGYIEHRGSKKTVR